MDNAPIGLYVHIPFCAKKCPYCDFYSNGYKKANAERYVRAVILRLRQFASCGRTADSLYFGGGTPSLLSPGQIGEIIEEARSLFSLSGEITMEANPNTLTGKRLADYRARGINRLSVGVQSFDEKELAALGRKHSAEQAKEAILAAKAAGFDDISLDLMLAVPYQTEESLLRTLNETVSLPVTHISAYLLKVEENTPYRNSPLLSRCPDEDTLAALYLKAVGFLKENGFLQYEISNFAKEGHESQHNLKYWECAPYLGVGAAAHSCFQGKRFACAPDLELFCAAAESGNFSDLTLLSETAGDEEERLMLALRLTKGLPVPELKRLLSPASHRRAFLFAERLIQSGLAQIQQDIFALTPQGFLVSNEILSEFMSFI